jgi:hypothetical protein
MKKFIDFITEEKPKVYKSTKTEYYSHQRKTPNPYTGSATVSKSRKVTDWVAVVNGKHIAGHSTKRSALDTWHKMNKKDD